MGINTSEVFLNIELRKARLWRYPIVEMLKLLFSTSWAVCVQHALTPEPVVSRNYRSEQLSFDAPNRRTRSSARSQQAKKKLSPHFRYFFHFVFYPTVGCWRPTLRSIFPSLQCF